MCKLIFELAEDLSNFSPFEVSYKKQEIRKLDSDGVIGFEILVNSNNMTPYERTIFFNNRIKQPSTVRTLIRHISRLITDDLAALDIYAGMKVFINLERSNLCDYFLLSELKALSYALNKKHIELVVEITERNICAGCKKVNEGILLLNVLDIPLAADDYDIYQGDFRKNELLRGGYEYVKIRAPKNLIEVQQLYEFSSTLKTEKIIIENIETCYDLNIVSEIEPFGVQGFYFGAEKTFS